MTSQTGEQVIIGKLSLSKANGQISIFSPPRSFAWLQQVGAEEIAAFLTELLDAVNRSQREADWSSVTEVIETWKATANIRADPIVMAGVEQGLAELGEGQGIGWTELREELGL